MTDLRTDPYPPVRTVEPPDRAGRVLIIVDGDDTDGAVRAEFVWAYLDAVLFGCAFLEVELSVISGDGPGVSEHVAVWCRRNRVEHKALPKPAERWGQAAGSVAARRYIGIAGRAEAAGWVARVAVFPTPGRRETWALAQPSRAAGFITDIEIENREAREGAA